jgi:hypothetical protein
MTRCATGFVTLLAILAFGGRGGFSRNLDPQTCVLGHFAGRYVNRTTFESDVSESPYAPIGTTVEFERVVNTSAIFCLQGLNASLVAEQMVSATTPELFAYYNLLTAVSVNDTEELLYLPPRIFTFFFDAPENAAGLEQGLALLLNLSDSQVTVVESTVDSRSIVLRAGEQTCVASTQLYSLDPESYLDSLRATAVESVRDLTPYAFTVALQASADA